MISTGIGIFSFEVIDVSPLWRKGLQGPGLVSGWSCEGKGRDGDRSPIRLALKPLEIVARRSSGTRRRTTVECPDPAPQHNNINQIDALSPPSNCRLSRAANGGKIFGFTLSEDRPRPHSRSEWMMHRWCICTNNPCIVCSHVLLSKTIH